MREIMIARNAVFTLVDLVVVAGVIVLLGFPLGIAIAVGLLSALSLLALLCVARRARIPPRNARFKWLLIVAGALTVLCGISLALAGGVLRIIPLVLVVGGAVVVGGALALPTGPSDELVA
jgi:hypothetical protein